MTIQTIEPGTRVNSLRPKLNLLIDSANAATPSDPPKQLDAPAIEEPGVTEEEQEEVVPSIVRTLTEVRAQRVTVVKRITNPQDSSQFVDVADPITYVFSGEDGEQFTFNFDTT